MIANNKFVNYFYILLLLFLIHFFSHFFPFERLSIAPDDYAHHQAIKNMNLYEIVSKWTDRPLHFLWASIIYNTIGYNTFIGTIALFIFSFIPTLITFFLFIKIFKSLVTPVALSIIFLLIPNKLEIYHTVVFIHINVVMSLYLISLLFFVHYYEKNKSYSLLISVVFYLIAIFWYEAGFFLPLLYFITLINKYNLVKSIKIILPFFIASLIYLSFRYTNGFGIGDNFSGRVPKLDSLFFITELFNSFFGRYIIRSIVYGVYNFTQIPIQYLSLIILSNIFLTFILFKFVNIDEEKKLNKKILYLSILLIIISLTPNLLAGSIGGRNLVIPAIGFSLIIYFLLFFFKKFRNFIFLFLFIFGMIISQGNNWAQVIASRINYSIFEQIKNDSEEIINAEFVIINVKDFANKIPFTLIKREFNNLNTYFGAQALEDWGLLAMVKYVDDKKSNNIFISYSNPIVNNNNELEFFIKNHIEYRSAKFKKIFLKNKNIYILNYDKVYKNSYKNGKNIH